MVHLKWTPLKSQSQWLSHSASESRDSLQFFLICRARGNQESALYVCIKIKISNIRCK